MGGSSEQALNEGATINQATAYGGLSGGLEVAVENAFGGLGKLMPDGVISNVVRKVTGNGIVSKITDVLGEGAEEYISTSIDPYLKRLTYDEKAELASNEEKLESFLVGSIISSVAQIGGSIGTNRQNNVNTPKLLPQIQQNTPQTLQPQGINSTTNINAPKIDFSEQGNINTSLENGVNAQNDMVNNILPNETTKPNKINEIVNRYINETKNDFKSQIDIRTEMVNEINYNDIKNNKLGQSYLSKKAESLVDKLKRRIFKNNGEDIFVTNSDIKKSIKETLQNKEQNKYIKENVAVFSQIDKIIENGKEIANSPIDNKNREQYNDYKYYVSNVYINGEPYVVEFDTRLQPGISGKQERHFRLERVYKINKADSNTAPNKLEGQFLNESTSTNIISQNGNNMQVSRLTNEQSIANNNNLVYNDNRGDINEGNQRGRINNGNDETSRLYENDQYEKNEKYTREQYERFEKSIKPIEQARLIPKEKEAITRYENRYNKTIDFFDGDGEFGGGASIIDPKKIFIDRKAANEFGIDRIGTHEVLESDINHNKLTKQLSTKVINSIINDTNFIKQKELFWQNQKGIIPPDVLIAKDILCDAFAETQNKLELEYENILSAETENNINKFFNKYIELKGYNKGLENKSSSFSMPKTPPNRTITPLPSRQEIATPPKKVDLVDISKMTQEDAELPPTPKYKLKDAGTINERSFYENVGTAESISKDIKNLLEPKTYNQITNEKSMQEAMERLDNGGRQEVDKWLSKDIKNTDNVDVAEGIVLLERYQQQGDFEGAVNIVEKLAEMGTKAGQQVQMFSILRRLTPEGMQIYAQRSLDKVFNELSKNKTNQWIEENKSETQYKILI